MKSRRVDFRIHEELINIIDKYKGDINLTDFIIKSLSNNLINNYNLDERDKIIVEFLKDS